MKTYRELFRLREFRVLFASQCLMMAAVAVGGLALGTITYATTGSPVLTSLAMFGGPLVRLVGTAFLGSMSDLLRPRQALVIVGSVACLSDLAQALPGLHWGTRFAILAVPWVLLSMTGGTAMALMSEIVPRDAFVLGRSTINIAIGAMQVVGYGLGGLLLLVLSTTDLFLTAALLSGATILLSRFGIADHPPRATGGGAVARTHAVNRHLLGSRVLCPVYLALWVPNGLVVGCESLFVPYAAERAGYLFAATAAGMLAGDIIIGRFVGEALRDKLVEPLRLLLALPYLGFLVIPSVPVAAVLGLVASAGYAASLPLQDRLLDGTATDIRGQVLGLYSTGLMVGQALGALLAGAVAQALGGSHTDVAHAAVAMSALSLVVTLSLTRGLRRSRPNRKILAS